MEIRIYKDEYENKWDKFIENESINGLFLQSRRFLNYHSTGRFLDDSLLFEKGEELLAVLPACCIEDCGKKVFFSHKGSTFGGLIVSEKANNLKCLTEILQLLEKYMTIQGYDRSILKMTPKLLCKSAFDDKLEYLLFQMGFLENKELNAYVDISLLENDILDSFSRNKRRDCRYALKNKLEFRFLETNEEIAEFHYLLAQNLKKHEAIPVHSLEELLLLKNEILNQKAVFFGVFLEEKMIAGSMVFIFNQEICHTQYIATHPNYLELFPTNYLYYQLLLWARAKKMKILTWGISTEQNGKKLNQNLAMFKESYGSKFTINRTFCKEYQKR